MHVAIGTEGRPGGHDRRTHLIETGQIDVHLGQGIGKGEHHATAVAPAGKKAFDKRLSDTESKLRELVGADQAGRLPSGPDDAADHRRPPGEAKTDARDARDAFIIADTARAMPPGSPRRSCAPAWWRSSTSS